MNETAPLRLLRQKLRERMNEMADTLAEGACASFDEYRFMCGQLQGLAYAERELLDLASQMERDDE